MVSNRAKPSICVFHLQYDDALGYAAKVVSITNDQYIEANARLAIGICYSHLASKGLSEMLQYTNIMLV